ncbi:MAG: porphobilinogen synthase [Acidimicrobiales bacterium]
MASAGSAAFPERRMRRLRRSAAMRRLVADTTVSVDDLVAPVFVREGIREPVPISTMPGVVQHTTESLVLEAKHIVQLGIPALVLFGVPERKDPIGSGAADPDGVAQRALRAVREAVSDELVLIADLCLDEYTDHGHCGVLDARGEVDNDATLERYAEVALAQVDAGADVVAPSGMMDGQVRAIRAALDSSGHTDVAVLAYAAKYASAMYGPFREAVNVSIAGGGDRRRYQEDPARRREGVAEALLDVSEGADIVMVKPALHYLDVLSEVARAVDVPVAAYHVSGEYSMLTAAAQLGAVELDAALDETLIAIKRAGADFILTYFAKRAAELIGAR